MATKKDIIKKLETSHSALVDLLNNIDTEREVYRGWTIKEVLAHLAGWDEATTASLSSFIQGGKPGIVAVSGVDAFNADSIAKRKKLSLEDTFHDWEHEREILLATLSALPENQLNDKIIFPRGDEGSVADMLLLVANHEAHHTKEIGNA
jgi:uncharacterized damage-inducible protein DinB